MPQLQATLRSKPCYGLLTSYAHYDIHYVVANVWCEECGATNVYLWKDFTWRFWASDGNVHGGHYDSEADAREALAKVAVTVADEITVEVM